MLCEPEQEFHLSLKSGMDSLWNSTLQYRFLVQSAITCTQDWNVVQYLVNKTNMDSFHNESLSVIIKIVPHTVTHLFDPFHQIHIALPSEIK